MHLATFPVHSWLDRRTLINQPIVIINFYNIEYSHTKLKLAYSPVKWTCNNSILSLVFLLLKVICHNASILLICFTCCSVDSLQGVDSPVGSPSFHTVSNPAAIGAHFAFGNVRRYVSPVGYIYYSTFPKNCTSYYRGACMDMRY